MRCLNLGIVERRDGRAAEPDRARWRELPPRIEPSEWVIEVPAGPPNPPEIGNPDRDFMLRYS